MDHATAVAVADDGSVVTVGEFNNTIDLDPGAGAFNVTANGDADAYVRKLDANGDFVWGGTLGGSGVDEAFDVALDAAGNAHVIGIFGYTADLDIGAGVQSVTSNNTTKDIFILKLDPNGNTIWAQTIGGPNNDMGRSLAVDDVGRVYVAGSFANSMDLDPGAGIVNVASAGQDDAFVLCLDATGAYQWGYRWGGTEDDRAWGIAADGAGNSTITGEFQLTVDLDPTAGTMSRSSLGAEDIFVIRFDPLGGFSWAVNMGGSGFERGVGVAVDAMGACIITGDMDSPTDIDPSPGVMMLSGSSFEDAFVLKLLANAQILWGFLLEGFLNDGLSAAVDQLDNVYVGGEYNGTTDMDPGPGVVNLTAVPGPNGYVASYTGAGTFRYAFRCGSIANAVALNDNVQLAVAGQLQGSSDMDPGGGVATLSAVGMQDGFVALYNDIAAGVEPHTAASPLLVHPNPTTGRVFVLDAHAGSSYNVVDAHGRSIKSGAVGASRSLDLSGLLAGVYTLCVADEHGPRIVRVVVEH